MLKHNLNKKIKTTEKQAARENNELCNQVQWFQQ